MPLFIYVDFLYHGAPEGALFFRFKAIVDTAEVLGKNGFHSLEVRALFLGGRSYVLRELGVVQLVVPAVFFQVNYFVQVQFFRRDSFRRAAARSTAVLVCLRWASLISHSRRCFASSPPRKENSHCSIASSRICFLWVQV